MTAETLARFGDELRVAYRLTLQRFLALQVHGSDEGRATLAKLRARLFERGEPPPAALSAALALLAKTDLRGALADVRVPALVVGGTRDALVPIEATRELAARLPDARLVAIDGAAHAPFLSHRASFLDAIVPFVDA
jgi:pimeloyl-[acyl-carrier protein] methyl ester esterase